MVMEYQAFAVRLAKKAGEIMQEYFVGDTEVMLKGEHGEMVTVADEMINQLVIAAVKKEYPDHGVLGEEDSFGVDGSRFVWVTDPIDGTINFARGIPVSVFSLALLDDGVPVLGVVYQPFADELFVAARGQGAFCNGKKISVSDRAIDDQGFLFGEIMWSWMPYDVRGVRAALWERGVNSQDMGTVAYMGCLVARGSMDATVFPHTKSWDLAAVKVIVEEAGGRESDLWGQQQCFDGEIRGNVVSNGVCHEELVGLCKDCLGEDEVWSV